MNKPQPLGSPPRSAPRGRLLLVEDDAGSAKALKAILQIKGWEVIVAATVAEAVQFLSLQPEYVVLDLMLPDGPGEAVLAKIRADGSKVRVAVTTGVSDPDRLEQVWALRPDCVVRKPIDLPELLRGLIPLS